jgi:ABC-2 type transport system ATP-binding protein
VPVDRPRRARLDALVEDPPFVPRRSLGFAADPEIDPEHGRVRGRRSLPDEPAEPVEPDLPDVPDVPDARPTLSLVRKVGHPVEPILVRRLVKSFGGRLAVRNLSFTVEPGRVTGLLGPAGAGKTTILRILVGLVAPTAGTATFGPTAYAALRHPQQTVGCVLESGFHPARSARNHLRTLAPTVGVSDRRVHEVLGTVGLTKVARQPVSEYSAALRQRLALAAAMLGRPDYLVLDEPANGLDTDGVRWLHTFLRDFTATGRTVLVASSLPDEIEEIADDVVMVDRGRLVDPNR